MKALVLYCRWHGARLHLQGRDQHSVWGKLVIEGDRGERVQTFRFDLSSRQLTLTADGRSRHIQLDEMGVVVE